MNEQITSANQETERLKEELENVNDPEYLERMAREKLGLVGPNERVYIDANSTN
ncbi:MAG: FtsB family cell division protein [Monoglobus pectinilyticus]